VFTIIFLKEKIRFKRNYLKRQGQGSGTTELAQLEKWVTALGQCGKGRRDEEKKSRLAAGNWTKRSMGI
jgi:hypothetical protein